MSLAEKHRETYYEKYYHTLTKQVMPFWLRYAVDESGALNNCLAEDGTVLSRDRYIWSQGRALWTFSAMYRRIEAKQEYLDVAHGLFRYLKETGRNADGKWNYLYDGEGNLLEDDISIYVDGFVLAGMTEYYLATGSEEAKRIALETYENSARRIAAPGSYRVAPYEIPEGTKTHGVNMIFSYFYYCLGKALGRTDIMEAGRRLGDQVLEQFYIKEKNAVLEFVTVDGHFLDTPEGRSCVPGHAVECMWFLISIFEDTGEQEKIQLCCDLIKRHIELAWDRKNGGMFLAMDIDGKEPVFWKKPDYKPWWVQLEALVATAYAYKHTRDEWFLKKHEQLFDFTFSHYPTPYGDFYNWLDKDGKIGESAALPVKDPFHLPRALMQLVALFGESLKGLSQQ